MKKGCYKADNASSLNIVNYFNFYLWANTEEQYVKKSNKLPQERKKATLCELCFVFLHLTLYLFPFVAISFYVIR